MSQSEATICILARSVLDRDAYRALLSTTFDSIAVVDADFTAKSIWTAMRRRPGVIVVDSVGSETPATEAVDIIRRLRSGTRVVVLSESTRPSVIRPWAGKDLHGLVAKDGGAAELAAGIGAVLSGKKYFSEGAEDTIVNGHSQHGKPQLTPRELELLPLLAQGLTLRQAAERMSVSYKTADAHRTRLLRKLGVRHRVELARYAIRERIIEA